MDKRYYRSPLGWIEAIQKDGILTSLSFVSRKPRVKAVMVDGVFRSELDAYFAGKSAHFSIRLKDSGTSFQKRVWRSLRSIPRGSTVSYKEVALKIRAKNSVRAVARAISQNPHMILTPCHRVIGSNGSLTGYAFGLARKAWLLKCEGCVA